MGWARNKDMADEFIVLVKHIRQMAEKQCWSDQLKRDKNGTVCGYAEYSPQRAYRAGQNAGKVLWARRLLALVENKDHEN
ncbi:hypothetical protein LCGC14_0142490 [marine sediment metagenome]|uniref:Uncharacterized protein n=1 Tax=marine sediment metagenome TaxID=412755 RepID=A0A0F9V4T9_9ZZZZ